MHDDFQVIISDEPTAALLPLPYIILGRIFTKKEIPVISVIK
jgi:hypothetical protein